MALIIWYGNRSRYGLDGLSSSAGRPIPTITDRAAGEGLRRAVDPSAGSSTLSAADVAARRAPGCSSAQKSSSPSAAAAAAKRAAGCWSPTCELAARGEPRRAAGASAERAAARRRGRAPASPPDAAVQPPPGASTRRAADESPGAAAGSPPRPTRGPHSGCAGSRTPACRWRSSLPHVRSIARSSHA